MSRSTSLLIRATVEFQSLILENNSEAVLLVKMSDDYDYNLTLGQPGDLLTVANATDGTWNSTLTTGSHQPLDLMSFALLIGVLSLLISFTVVGNISVMVAISLDKNLQTKSNCLVFSLAFADLMVACLVMPLAAVYEVHREWNLGPQLCDVWTSFDVLCCTASILHLVAIAVDRYWAVTNIDYVRQRQSWRVAVVIALIWLAAMLISLAPLVGWRDPKHDDRVATEKRCLVSQDAGYQLFATCVTFYVPLVAILLLYWRIFLVARKRIRRKPGGTRGITETRLVSATILAPLVTEMTVISTAATTTTTTSSSHPSSDVVSTNDLLTDTDVTKEDTLTRCRLRRTNHLRNKRERKAAKTLSIITGIFVICWLPFFIIALLMPFCEACQPSQLVFSFTLWLGYANSMVNPIIYTIFSPDFRIAFKQLFMSICRWAICRKCRSS